MLRTIHFDAICSFLWFDTTAEGCLPKYAGLPMIHFDSTETKPMVHGKWNDTFDMAALYAETSGLNWSIQYENRQETVVFRIEVSDSTATRPLMDNMIPSNRLAH